MVIHRRLPTLLTEGAYVNILNKFDILKRFGSIVSPL